MAAVAKGVVVRVDVVSDTVWYVSVVSRGFIVEAGLVSSYPRASWQAVLAVQTASTYTDLCMRKSHCVSAGVQPLVFHWQEAARDSDQEVSGSCLKIALPLLWSKCCRA
jgi:hypothetical protein